MSEENRKRRAALLAGGAAGLVNGFFGGGGGMVLVPLFIRRCKLCQQNAFASSVAVILPLCVLSASIYLYHGNLNLATAAPYLAGGLVGGLIGGKIFHRVSMVWLRRLFALLILYGAFRSLCA
ncbi:MAG: hypothetical protein H6Q61_129 [Firmicutes bacterium]|nr:hypothetical protein [Bacillota bacterium]